MYRNFFYTGGLLLLGLLFVNSIFPSLGGKRKGGGSPNPGRVCHYFQYFPFSVPNVSKNISIQSVLLHHTDFDTTLGLGVLYHSVPDPNNLMAVMSGLDPTF